MDSKKLVRSVLESFLLSDAAGEDEAKGGQPDVRGEADEVAAEAPVREVKMELGESGGRVICEVESEVLLHYRESELLGRHLVFVC